MQHIKENIFTKEHYFIDSTAWQETQLAGDSGQRPGGDGWLCETLRVVHVVLDVVN